MGHAYSSSLLAFSMSDVNGPGCRGGRGLAFIRSFIHSFIQATSIAHLQVHYTTQRRSRHSTDTVSEFHAEAPQATASEGLDQGPYVAARAGFKPETLRTKGAESTNGPPRHYTVPGYDERLGKFALGGQMSLGWHHRRPLYARDSRSDSVPGIETGRSIAPMLLWHHACNQFGTMRRPIVILTV